MLASLALLITAATPPKQERIRYVTDGDTFRLESGERIRIADIDAPETRRGQAKCTAEIVLGQTASTRARALLNRRDVGLVRTGRSYNRTVARVTLSGRDLATELVRIGVARWWPRGTPKPDWCAMAPR
ncbi:thermonuclease family protein [Sphingomonas sp. So64.6b]|nr:thermonuclease family protein [Sphingomonas sp. So64.6b]